MIKKDNTSLMQSFNITIDSIESIYSDLKIMLVEDYNCTLSPEELAATIAHRTLGLQASGRGVEHKGPPREGR